MNFLYQIEVTELTRKVNRSQKALADNERAKQALERKYSNLSEERDRLAQHNLQLRAAKRDMKGRLNKVDDLKTQVTHEHVSTLADTVVSKTEVNDLIEQIKNLTEELTVTRFQVSYQYRAFRGA